MNKLKLKEEVNKILYKSKHKHIATDKIIKLIQNERNVLVLENPLNIQLYKICKNNLNDLLKFTDFRELRRIKRRLKNITYKIGIEELE